MSEIQTCEPLEFVAGETVQFEKSFDDYLSSDGWSLNYYFRGAGSLDQTAEAQADGSFLVTLSSEKTAELAPGTYFWQGWVELDGEKHMIASGQVEVAQGLAGDLGAYDGRSPAKKILDAIDAMVAGKATRDQQEYTIAGGSSSRTLKRIPIPELMELRKTYARKVAQERRRARVKRGGTLFQSVKVRFDEP
jgi:hypothetical protein